LRDEQPPWPQGLDPDAVLHQAEVEGVIPLLHEKLAGGSWPAPVRDELRRRSVGQAMWELRHQQVLNGVFEALNARDIEAIIIKGTALAYSLYANPLQRSRGDTDLLVPESGKQTVFEVLEAAGFQRALAVDGDLVSYQASFTRVVEDGSVHSLDLHWKINNSEVLSRLFTYDELRRDAIPLPALGPHALGTSRTHSLLIACMHRATHRFNPYYAAGEAHHDPDRLIWLADIHWLARSLDASEWEAACSAARQKGLSRIVSESLECSAVAWGTQVSRATAESLAGARTGDDLASRYLSAPRVEQWKMDWNARPGWGTRWRWLVQTLLPPPAYMRQQYADVRPRWIAWLYCRRAVLGILKRAPLPAPVRGQSRHPPRA
jgi:hypothetical protein